MKKYINEIGIGIILMLFVFVNDFSNLNNWSSGELIGFNLWAVFLPLLGFVIFMKGILGYRNKVK